MDLGTHTMSLPRPCAFRWPQRATCDIQHHWMVPFSICHAVVLFTSSCQMGIIMNAFTANVTKPNITRAGDEMDSRGGSAVPTKRLEMGSLVCTGNCLRGHLTGAYFCQRRKTSELLMQSSRPAFTGNSGCSEWLRFSPLREWRASASQLCSYYHV